MPKKKVLAKDARGTEIREGDTVLWGNGRYIVNQVNGTQILVARIDRDGTFRPHPAYIQAAATVKEADEDGPMTVAALIAHLQGLPGHLPVHMFSDAEGNSEHPLEAVSFDGPDEDLAHATAILLIPSHESYY